MYTLIDQWIFSISRKRKVHWVAGREAKNRSITTRETLRNRDLEILEVTSKHSN